ncbi:MAG: glutamine--fructose-6-phosphate transaminase (isomerizing) [Sulfolobales archaeon]|nr:glutamine--fructose-6-phosphate transaminase (isomerizing) [Sulfolobales archaeon]MDW8010343.1 glutamine--fructose-6-phosphate transaminase (isomerizing) [Sulfolobales archaeon]
MCGIVAITSSNRRGDLGILLTEALKKLEYRGYDSVGIAVVDQGNLYVAKNVGTVESVAKSENFASLSGCVGIGHTRWATHGAPSKKNSHPHTDCAKKIAVVHNGIIENYSELKNFLLSRGHVFISDTDTEVVPHLIEEFKRAGLDTYSAFRKAVSMLRGTFAIVAIDIDGGRKLLFTRKVSPLVVGIGSDFVLVSSDIVSILPYTDRVVVLNDDEVGYAEPGRVFIETVGGRSVDVASRVMKVDYGVEDFDKGPYEHYMIKEIREQPYTLNQTLSGLISSRDEVEKSLKLLESADSIYIVGAGSSYYASLLGSLYFRYLGFRAQALVSSEATPYLRGVRPGDVVVVVSQSGETIDTLLAMRESAKRGARVVAIVNNPLSTIARESDAYVYMKSGPEICVAATKTFTSQVLVLSYLGLAMTRDSHRIEASLRALRRLPEITASMISSTENAARKVAKKISTEHSVYYLGRAFGYPISAEAALKMKEVAYVHAEAYPAGESKHGPIALVASGFPVVFTIVGELDELIEGNIEEMKARGAYVITYAPSDRITSTVERNSDLVIPLPQVLLEVSLVTYVIPHQLLAYYTSIERGYNPDRPRNLAKTVTVF